MFEYIYTYTYTKVGYNYVCSEFVDFFSCHHLEMICSHYTGDSTYIEII